ncbi:MAG: glycosyltransferase family 4 protein [Verrucomicrobiales bacterium]|nr:glycosyltransferase family 4 protein [Verrucomicrobiales bacterium]
MIPVAVNARFRNRPLTGVERFATEVCRELSNESAVEIREILPAKPKAGLRGHAWEQFILPGKPEKNEILFSPCNTGPVRVERQLPVIHDAAVWDSADTFGFAFQKVYRTILPQLARKSRAVGTVSEFSRIRLAECLRIPEEKIHVLGNAVSSDFSPPPERHSSNTLLCVGSLDPRKNFSRLLLAWQSLQKDNRLPDSARLDIIGAANPKNFSHVEQEGVHGVNWLGRVSDAELVRHYQNAKAFIFPSFYEGFGLPPLEAMACGTPVLLSRAASLPEVGGPEFSPQDPSGNGAALYFDPMSENEMANAIEKAFRCDEATSEKWSRNALDRAGQFSWRTVAQRTGAIFEGL